MTHWPELPVNVIIKWLKDRTPSLIVADFGCGRPSIHAYFNLIFFLMIYFDLIFGVSGSFANCLS